MTEYCRHGARTRGLARPVARRHDPRGVESPLHDAIGQKYSCLAYFVSGMALGWAWYRLYPRDLASRLFRLTVACSVVGVAALIVPGGDEFVLISNPSANDGLPLGVLAGLVLTEASRPGGEWRHQKRTALTSRQTMRDLR